MIFDSSSHSLLSIITSVSLTCGNRFYLHLYSHLSLTAETEDLTAESSLCVEDLFSTVDSLHPRRREMDLIRRLSHLSANVYDILIHGRSSCSSKRRKKYRSEGWGASTQTIAFHPKSGKGVRRSADGTTIYKKHKFWGKKKRNSFSFSHRPIGVDELVMIEINNMACVVGLVPQDPDTLTDIQSSTELFDQGLAVAPVVVPQKSSSFIEVHLTRSGDINISVDGQDSAVYFNAINPSQPAWIFIDMYDKMKDMPVRFMSLTSKQRASKSKAQTNDHKLCDLCCNNKADAVLGECGHDNCCFSCAKQWILRKRYHLKSCPYCRRHVKSIVRMIETESKKMPN